MSSTHEQKRKMQNIDHLHPVPESVIWTANTTKVVPVKNNKRSKSKIQDDLDRLRKSRQFRELGDALNYFSD